MGHFLWNNTEDRHKYHLASWQLVAQKKEEGGLGIPDLRSLNLALLASWIFRYHLHKNAIWVKIVDFKYNTNDPNILLLPRSRIIPFLERGPLGSSSCPYGRQMGSREWEEGKVLGRSMGRKYKFGHYVLAVVCH